MVKCCPPQSILKFAQIVAWPKATVQLQAGKRQLTSGSNPTALEVAERLKASALAPIPPYRPASHPPLHILAPQGIGPRSPIHFQVGCCDRLQRRSSVEDRRPFKPFLALRDKAHGGARSRTPLQNQPTTEPTPKLTQDS
jgi:hypothetical protein